MKKIKNIMIITLTFLVITFSLGCEKVFQVKRIDNDKPKPVENVAVSQEQNLSKEDDGKGDAVDEEEPVGEEKVSSATPSDTLPADLPQEELSPASESVATAEEERGAEVSGEKEGDNLAVSQEVLSYLLLTGSVEDELLGPHQKNYLVGEDHFVHLQGAVYNLGEQSPQVNVKWMDFSEKTIYKEEKIQFTPDENPYLIHSILGLTKKVPGQDELPDALGDYWVIIEVNNKKISKTQFSIVAKRE